jgi:palmitoyltransferase
MLGGQSVDYTSMYESPRLAMRRRGGGEAYEAVAAEDTV